MQIEYKVRPVTRYIVTRYEGGALSSVVGGEGLVISHKPAVSSTKGEYSNAEMAYEVAYALCKAEHEALGYPPYDERIQYPQAVNEQSSP